MIRILVLLICVSTITPSVCADDSRQSRDDWQAHFDKFDAQGAIIIVDQRGDASTTWVYNEPRVQSPVSPASTYKIPHALFALEAGVVRDEFDRIKWDGTQRSYGPWNQDQTLRSSMRHSVIWVYERFAEELGEAKVRDYLARADYGNAEPTVDPDAEGEPEPYWVNGRLEISPEQQVAFLQRLYYNQLPFEVRHQRLVKDIMIVQAERDWILRAKTGWDGQRGWWVGWVEWPDGPVFFALNIDVPNRWDDLYKRQAITQSILQELGALPREEE